MHRYSYPGIPSSLIQSRPAADLQCIVTIPAYKEPDMKPTLESLWMARPSKAVEVIVLINERHDDTPSTLAVHEACYTSCLELADDHVDELFRIYPIYIRGIPPKMAGVGLARKWAMDEAARRFELLDRPSGIIACLDADTTCDHRYFTALFDHFNTHATQSGAVVHFEHVVDGLSKMERRAIVDYELHLRYFVGMQQWLNLPYAVHTVGSAMAAPVWAYRKIGGMNKRQAGEDFYFINKLVKSGPVGQVIGTCVHPSARLSDRVPFGTGRAVAERFKTQKEQKTYNPQSFVVLRCFLQRLPSAYRESTRSVDWDPGTMDAAPRTFFLLGKAQERLTRIAAHSTSSSMFLRRFYEWFDGFRLMKYLHFMRDEHYPNIDVLSGAQWYDKNVRSLSGPTSAWPALQAFRRIQANPFEARHGL